MDVNPQNVVCDTLTPFCKSHHEFFSRISHCDRNRYGTIDSLQNVAGIHDKLQADTIYFEYARKDKPF